MTCQSCNRFAPADRDTGYNADDLCAECAEREDIERDGHIEQIALRDVARAGFPVAVAGIVTAAAYLDDDCPF